jgi:hypothetical protein
VTLMPCASNPVFRPAGRLVAMTACQGIVTAAPLNTEPRQPAFLRQDAGRHCGGSDGTLVIGAGNDDRHESAAFIEIESCRIALACVYAHAVEAVQGRTDTASRNQVRERQRMPSIQ